jgi:beta-lactamase class A
MGRRAASGLAGWLGGGLLLSSALTPWEVSRPVDPSPPVRLAALPLKGQSERDRLQRRLASLARDFDGQVGLFVRPLDAPWSVSVNADQVMPQQSVSKLWVAVAVLAAVDRGELSLDETVTIRREDLSIFHQPIRAFVGDSGYRTTLRRLLAGALQQSDNAANDALIRRLGGPFSVQVSLVGRNLEGVRFGPGERTLQTAAAGLGWKPEYSFGRTFWQERDALSAVQRRTALAAYLADPPDGATARGVAEALARLQAGQLLSPDSTALMLGLMEQSATGQGRLRGGLAPGWRLAHKTGTGQVMGSLATGYNDVGLFTAPDGRVYAAAVMIARTRRPLAERQAFMAAVARAICDTAAPLTVAGPSDQS